MLLILIHVLSLTSCQTAVPHLDHQARWDCGGKALRNSWEQIQANLLDADKAQQLANAILCLPRTADVNNYINAHLAESIGTFSYGTGDLEEDRDTLTIARARDRFGGYGESPDRIYTVSLAEAGDIAVEASNEACIDATILRHGPKSDWLITRSDSACD
mgnify:FL=1